MKRGIEYQRKIVHKSIADNNWKGEGTHQENAARESYRAQKQHEEKDKISGEPTSSTNILARLTRHHHGVSISDQPRKTSATGGKV